MNMNTFPFQLNIGTKMEDDELKQNNGTDLTDITFNLCDDDEEDIIENTKQIKEETEERTKSSDQSTCLLAGLLENIELRGSESEITEPVSHTETCKESPSFESLLKALDDAKAHQESDEFLKTADTNVTEEIEDIEVIELPNECGAAAANHIDRTLTDNIPHCYEDPWVKMNRYFAKHEIIPLFHKLTTSLYLRRHPDCIQFMIEEVERLRREKLEEEGSGDRDKH